MTDRPSLRLILPGDAGGKSQAFYDKLLPGRRDQGVSGRASFATGRGTLDVVPSDEIPEALGDEPALHMVIEVEDIEAALEDVRTTGGVVERGPFVSALGQTAIVFDPDGNEVVLAQPPTDRPGR